jgi:hypothetical protein
MANDIPRLMHDPEKLALDVIGGANLFSEKIMLKQGAKARWRFNQATLRFSG